MVGDRTHFLNLAFQGAKIHASFPLSRLSVNHNRLIWTHTITPSALSASYGIKLIYERDKQPNVYVVTPKLERYPGKLALPHVYDTENQCLCLYLRGAGEWKSNMFLADTVIPWTCEWLLHYEFWLTTGAWHGGGIHYVREAEKQENGEHTESDERKNR